MRASSMASLSSCPVVAILLLSTILGAALTNANDSSSQCTLCLNGEEFNPLFGTKPIGMTVPIAVPDCNALMSIVTIVPEANFLCEVLRYLSTYCGCSRPENSCQLCPESRPVMKNKTTNLDSLDVVGSLPGDIRVVLSQLDGAILSCEQLDSAMSTFHSDDPICSSLKEGDQETLQATCGCTEEEPAEEQGRNNSCSFCVGGRDLPYIPTTTSIHFQDPTSKPISCQSLFDLTLETEADSPLCASIQEHSYSCGCPPARNESTTVSSCSICNGKKLLNKEFLLVVDGVVTNCQNYEAKLRTMKPDEDCIVTDDIVEQCGCVDEEQQESCSICPGGEPIGLPDKDVTSAVQRSLIGIFDAPAYTCGMVQTGLAFETKDSLACKSVHLMAKICGCPPRESSCSICGASGSSIMTKPDAQFILGYNDVIGRRSDVLAAIYETGPTFDSYATNQLMTCELADSALNYVLPEDDPENCFPIQLSNSHHCGCSPPNTKGVAMLWMQRGFAIVSMIGSILIILFIMMWDKKKRFVAYNQILLGISSFDFINSFAMALGSLPAPANLGIYGSKGNIHTCRLQGFMYQLGLTSIAYNVVLSSYFFRVDPVSPRASSVVLHQPTTS